MTVDWSSVFISYNNLCIDRNLRYDHAENWVCYLAVHVFFNYRQQKIAEREKRAAEQQRKKMEKEAQRLMKKEQNKIGVKLS